jgi:urocanate hydratase
VEVDPSRIRRRVETGYCDRMCTNLDEAIALAEEPAAQKRPLSIGLSRKRRDCCRESLLRVSPPDVVTDQTSAHDCAWLHTRRQLVEEAPMAGSGRRRRL